MTVQRFLFSDRPSKQVERAMIVDACRRLEHIAKLEEYGYVGLGGLEFVDFDMVHRHLGIRRMTSIEREVQHSDRYEFNKPYREIDLKFGEASEYLPTLDWSGLCIVWLDYPGQLDDATIRDCETVVQELQPGSVLIVTLNAHTKPGKRRATLNHNVGAERIPDRFQHEESMQAEWAFANAQRAILIERLAHIAHLRTPPVNPRQFLNFHYRDSVRMQTIGWIVSNPGLDQVVEQSGIESLEVSRTGEEALVLKLPVLTRRETLYLNRKLPVTPGASLEEPWLEQVDQAEYANLYRWYPTPV